MNPEKRPKIKDKPLYAKNTTNYEPLKNMYEDPVDITSTYNTPERSNSAKDLSDTSKEQSPADNVIELKTECDDDIIVTDPAVCNTHKGYEGNKDGKKDLTIPLDYHSPQDSKYFLFKL